MQDSTAGCCVATLRLAARRVHFKHLRKTKHTHHPVDDAEALLDMKDELGLKINWL